MLGMRWLSWGKVKKGEVKLDLTQSSGELRWKLVGPVTGASERTLGMSKFKVLSYGGSGSEQAQIFDQIWLECGRCNRREGDGVGSLDSGAGLVRAAKWRLRTLSWGSCSCGYFGCWDSCERGDNLAG